MSGEVNGPPAPVSLTVADGVAVLYPVVVGIAPLDPCSAAWIKPGGVDSITGDFTIRARIAVVTKSHNPQIDRDFYCALHVAEKVGGDWDASADRIAGFRIDAKGQPSGQLITMSYSTSGIEGTFSTTGRHRKDDGGAYDLALVRTGDVLNVYSVSEGGSCYFVATRALTNGSECRIVLRAAGEISEIGVALEAIDAQRYEYNTEAGRIVRR